MFTYIYICVYVYTYILYIVFDLYYKIYVLQYFFLISCIYIYMYTSYFISQIFYIQNTICIFTYIYMNIICIHIFVLFIFTYWRFLQISFSFVESHCCGFSFVHQQTPTN